MIIAYDSKITIKQNTFLNCITSRSLSNGSVIQLYSTSINDNSNITESIRLLVSDITLLGSIISFNNFVNNKAEMFGGCIYLKEESSILRTSVKIIKNQII